MGRPATWTAANGNVWEFIRTERSVGVEGFSPEHQRRMWYLDRIHKVTRPDGTVYYDYEMIDCQFSAALGDAGHARCRDCGIVYVFTPEEGCDEA